MSDECDECTWCNQRAVALVKSSGGWTPCCSECEEPDEATE